MPNLADTPEPIKQCPDMVGLRSCRGIPQPGEWRRGRCGRRERDERQDHPQTVPTELDPVDYRLEQSPVRHRLAGITSRLCRKCSASAMIWEYRPMAAPFVERGPADGPRSF